MLAEPVAAPLDEEFLAIVEGRHDDPFAVLVGADPCPIPQPHHAAAEGVHLPGLSPLVQENPFSATASSQPPADQTLGSRRQVDDAGLLGLGGRGADVGLQALLAGVVAPAALAASRVAPCDKKGAAI